MVSFSYAVPTRGTVMWDEFGPVGFTEKFLRTPPALPGVEGRVLCLGLFPPPIFQGKLPGYSGLVARVYPLSHLDCFLLIFSILKDLTCIAPAVLKLTEIRLPRLPSVFF